MIGIIGAMQVEVDGFIQQMEQPVSETVSGITYTTGKLCGREVVAAVCGVGKVFAAICAQTMILRYAPTLILNTGVGGTLTPRLGIGDVAVASDVVQHDMDLSPLGDPKGMLSGIDVIRMPCDPLAVEELERSLTKIGRNCVRGTIASGDQFVASKEEKDRIVRDFGAVVCEMEGGSIGQVCYVNRTPFAVVRAVSDSADGGAPEDFPQFAKEAAAHSIAAVMDFLAAWKS